jgi:hypothetical protein
MAAKQSAKGSVATVAAATTYKNPFTGGNIGPVRNTDNLAETDANRDRGTTYVVSSGVEGSPEFYARDASAGAWLFWALGADAPTGTMPNFTHVLTPANTLPYITVWRNISATLYEQYKDCKVSSLTFSADTGGPLTISANVQGLSSTRLAADPDNTGLAPLANAAVYNFNEATVTLGGGATSLVSSFELTIENNVTRQQTDAVEPYDVVEGVREVSLGFDLIFENLTEYNNFHYASQAAGTAVSNTVYTTSALFSFDKGANNSIAFNLPSIAYEEFPVEPNAGGDPITVAVRAVAQRGASPVVTATVKNQVATY